MCGQRRAYAYTTHISTWIVLLKAIPTVYISNLPNIYIFKFKINGQFFLNNFAQQNHGCTWRCAGAKQTHIMHHNETVYLEGGIHLARPYNVIVRRKGFYKHHACVEGDWLVSTQLSECVLYFVSSMFVVLFLVFVLICGPVICNDSLSWCVNRGE